MQPVFHSVFLQALGFAIANSLWQTALVWLMFVCVNNLVSFSAAVKYRLAVAAQFTGFAWFLVTLQFYYSQYSVALQHSPAVSTAVQSVLSVNTDFSSRLINVMLKAEQFLPYVSMAYLLLMVFLSIRWFLGYRQTQLIRRNGLQKIPANWRLFITRIAAQLGIKKEIRLYLSDAVTTPLTVGFFKPIILIPIASINHLSTDQLEAVLLHEMAHIKRYDYLLNIILSVVELTLFFNPFTQLLSKSIRKERENSCDDWVLQFKYNATVYAEALLRIAYLQTAPAFAMAASGKKNDLLVRVKRMIDKKDNRFSYRKQLLVFFIVTGMLISIAWLNPIAATQHKQATAAEMIKLPPQKIQPYAVEPMTVSVDNPLFNPMFFLSRPLKDEMKKNIASAQKEIAALGKDDKKKDADLITSISPIVANALEQASAALTGKQQTDWEKDIANMAFAKTTAEKTLRNDSTIHSLTQKMKSPFVNDLARSVKEMNEEIRKARLEMEKTLSDKKTVYFDKEKVEKDIKQAMDELNRMDLGKLVADAMEIPGLVFSEENNHPRKIRMATSFFPGAVDNMRKLKKSNPPETGALCPDQQKTETDIDEDAVMIPKIIAPAEQEKMRIDPVKLLRLRQLMMKEAFRRQIKVIPVTYTIDGEKETKLIIEMQ